MKTKLAKIIVLIFISLFSLIPIASPVLAYDICSDTTVDLEIRRASGCSTDGKELPDVIVNIINAVILVLGIIAVIFIIIGGVGYMTSAGDAGKVKKAKDTILYACIGLVVCALAFAIVNFTIGILNKTDGEEEEGFIHKNNVAYLEKSL